MSRGWLIVFAKAPRPGLVKTRLSPPLSPDESAALYEEMLADVLAVSARAAVELELDPVLAFHPPDAVADLIGLVPAGFRLHVQRGDDLAQRMANAFAEAAAAGAENALLRGSDSPALEPAILRDAFQRLENGDDLVLTPDQSGGYALIGMRRPHPAIFELAMSTDEVLDQTLEIARASGLRVSLTRPSFDLDTVGGFHFFGELSRAQLLDLCPRTVEAISDLPLDVVL